MITITISADIKCNHYFKVLIGIIQLQLLNYKFTITQDAR